MMKVTTFQKHLNLITPDVVHCLGKNASVQKLEVASNGNITLLMVNEKGRMYGKTLVVGRDI